MRHFFGIISLASNAELWMPLSLDVRCTDTISSVSAASLL
jgi:hypothetical protein